MPPDYDMPLRELPDGRWLAVIPLTFGRGRLVTQASADAWTYDDHW
jgi:hypothetical protein